EYRKTLRTTGQTSGIYFNEWDRPQLGALNSKSIDVSDDNIEEINNIKKIIDDTISNRGALILYHHQLVDNHGQYEAKTEHVETILDYIKEKIDSGDIESVTISELYNRLNDYR